MFRASQARPRVAVIALALAVLRTGPAAAEVTASLDSSRISQVETVVLQLSVSGSSDTGAQPDLTPLGADFDVLGQSSNQQTTILNGRVSSTRGWQLTLAPKRSGTLTVPPIRIGSETSDALTLEVLSAEQAAAVGELPAVLLEVDATPEQPFVQGQIRYTVRLLTRVPLRDASLSTPEVPDAIVQTVGQDRRTTTMRDGERFEVVERQYAIFPQHSGILRISSPVLSALVPDERANRQRFGDRRLGNDPFGGLFELGDFRQLRARGDEVVLEVLPQPATAGDPWMPAKDVTLSETFSPDPPEFRVGEPVTRDIVLTARGLTAAQLPDIVMTTDEGAKLYPDVPQSETSNADDDLVASKRFKTAIVPTRPGLLHLPRVEVTWWDVERQRERVATLPARTVDVMPDESAPAGSSSISTAPPSATDPVPSPGDNAPVTDVPAAPDSDIWRWVSAALGVAWMATIGLWWQAASGRRRLAGRAAADAPAEARQQSLRAARREVERACNANDARRSRDALLQWARLRWPDAPPPGLPALAERMTESSARQVFRSLDQHLYAPAGAGAWDGVAAWVEMADALKDYGDADAPRRVAALPGLYPGARTTEFT